MRNFLVMNSSLKGQFFHKVKFKCQQDSPLKNSPGDSSQGLSVIISRSLSPWKDQWTPSFLFSSAPVDKRCKCIWSLKYTSPQCQCSLRPPLLQTFSDSLDKVHTPLNGTQGCRVTNLTAHRLLPQHHVFLILSMTPTILASQDCSLLAVFCYSSSPPSLRH